MQLDQNPQLQQLNTLLNELKRRETHPSKTYIPDDRPERNQLGFHKSIAWARLAFGGNRSGKSRSAAQEIFWWATESHPHQPTPKGPRIWVISTEYRTIFEGVYSHLKNILPDWQISRTGPKVPDHDIPTFIEFKSGARIDFLSAKGDARQKFQAAEIDLLAIDEEISDDFWDELQMRLVTRGGRVIISATLVESVQWLLDLEDDSTTDLADRHVYLARLNTKFNPYNNQERLQTVLRNLSDEEKEVRILGNRRRLSGIIYNTFLEQHVCKPFNIPDGWTKVQVLDPGYRVAAAAWFAIAPVDQWGVTKRFLYREMYLRQTDLISVVHFIRTAEGFVYNSEDGKYHPTDQIENIFIRLIDPSAFRKLEDGNAGVGLQLANDWDLYYSPAENDKRTNIEAVRRWLQLTPRGEPQFQVFDTCENFLMERRKYRLRDPNKDQTKDDPTPRPLKRHDHLMNCWEYGATAGIHHIPGLTRDQRLRKDALENIAPLTGMHRVRMFKEKNKIRQEAFLRGEI